MTATVAAEADATAATHYQRPGWFVRRVMNPAMAALARLGVSVWGARVLEVTGRRSGATRSVPVNVLSLEAERYLVAPRGETDWVRNVRAADGAAVLVLGRRRTSVTLVEVADDAKEQILRGYLRRWKAEVGVFFGGVDHTSPAAELAAIAPRHPVFRIVESVG